MFVSEMDVEVVAVLDMDVLHPAEM